MVYHEESYHEQMEAQYGPYSNDAPLAIDPRDVDAALRRIEWHIATYPLASNRLSRSLQSIIAKERERLGLRHGVFVKPREA